MMQQFVLHHQQLNVLSQRSTEMFVAKCLDFIASHYPSFAKSNTKQEQEQYVNELIRICTGFGISREINIQKIIHLDLMHGNLKRQIQDASPNLSILNAMEEDAKVDHLMVHYPLNNYEKNTVIIRR